MEGHTHAQQWQHTLLLQYSVVSLRLTGQMMCSIITGRGEVGYPHTDVCQRPLGEAICGAPSDVTRVGVVLEHPN